MNSRKVWLPLVLAALTIPGALTAQQSRGWMGVAFDWESSNAREARVAEVVEGSAAERSGIREGDVVVRVNRSPATEATIDSLRDALEAGDTVRLRIRRGGAEQERIVVAQARGDRVARGRGGNVTITGIDGPVTFRVDSIRPMVDSLLGRMDSLRSLVNVTRRDSTVVLRYRKEGGPGDSMVMNIRPLERISRDVERTLRNETALSPLYLELGRRSVAGAELAEMNEELGRYFRTSEGVLVLRVPRSTPAARAGLQAGDVIVRAAGAEVGTVAELRRAFTRADDGRVRLEVIRQGARRSVDVDWRQPREERQERIRVFRSEDN
ncbi:MAG TPA: PDZ domain-containing protein [Longimicrobium sp.]|jgi:predicted metalloprotease with PDZ domain